VSLLNVFRFFYNARSGFRSALIELLSFWSLPLWDTVAIPSIDNNYTKMLLATGYLNKLYVVFSVRYLIISAQQSL